MKFKKWGLISILAVILLVLIIYWLFYDVTLVKRINSNIHLDEIKLLQDESIAKDHLGYGKRIPNKGLGQIYHYEKQGLTVYYEDQRVESISTTNPEHSVYGIHVGDEEKKAREILEKKHVHFYSEDQAYDMPNTNIVTYATTKNKVLVSYESTDGNVVRLTVTFNKSPKNNITP